MTDFEKKLSRSFIYNLLKTEQRWDNNRRKLRIFVFKDMSNSCGSECLWKFTLLK